MKYLWVGVLVISHFTPAFSMTAGENAVNEALARAWFEQAKSLGEADAGELWNMQVDGPMLFADPISRKIVANQPDAEGKLSESDGLWIGSLAEDVGIANYAVDWAGVRWTMVMWPLPDERYARGRLMMHECFHRIQDELGLPASNPSNNHLDERDGRIWLQMEWRALAEALLLNDPKRKGAIEDALIFRSLRHMKFEGAAESERELEMNEGLAEYTGYHLCGLPIEVLPDRVSIRLSEAQGQAGFVRNFAYVSGPAYGLLLDAYRTGWRGELSAVSDLGTMLAEAIGFTLPDHLEEEALRRVGRYEGERLIVRETERDHARQERVASYRARFMDGPILVLPLTENVNYTYNPNGLEAIDDAQTVYESLRVVDAWGILEVNGGALVARKDGHVDLVRVPAPGDLATKPIEGDGWTLRLNEDWRLTPGEREGDFTVEKQ